MPLASQSSPDCRSSQGATRAETDFEFGHSGIAGALEIELRKEMLNERPRHTPKYHCLLIWVNIYQKHGCRSKVFYFSTSTHEGLSWLLRIKENGRVSKERMHFMSHVVRPYIHLVQSLLPIKIYYGRSLTSVVDPFPNAPLIQKPTDKWIHGFGTSEVLWRQPEASSNHV